MQHEKRRLAVIVAADIAGYSRLVGENEEDTVRALRFHRLELIDPLIDEYDGRIANTAGDSLLLEFPSAVDALRSAIAVQDGMADRNKDIEPNHQICFRIGINVGDVIAEGGDLLGDGVNVAARLQEMSEPGEFQARFCEGLRVKFPGPTRHFLKFEHIAVAMVCAARRS